MKMPEAKACGEYHPLGCGLDFRCKVPSEYWKGELSNQEIVEKWEDSYD